jgi:hypothetical protein
MNQPESSRGTGLRRPSTGNENGDLVILDDLKPKTRRAYKEIAAAIVDGYR